MNQGLNNVIIDFSLGLHADIWQLVLHYLDFNSLFCSVIRVSSTLRKMVLNSLSLFKYKFSFYPISNLITDERIQQFITIIPSLSKTRHISCYKCMEITDQSLNIITKNCISLKSLNLDYCSNITDYGIQAIATNCSERLISLSLKHCYKITNNSILYISSHCINISKIYLNMCYKINDQIGLFLNRGCHHISTIVVDGCSISDSFIHFLSYGENNIYLINKLSFSFCLQITDKTFIYISKYCKNILELDFRSCTRITDSSIYHISSNCHYIKHLCLAGCIKLTNRCSLLLSQGCKELEILDLSGIENITNDTALFLATGCLELHILDLSMPSEIPEQTVVSSHLSFGIGSYTFTPNRSSRLNEELIIPILSQKCNKLKTIHLPHTTITF